MGEVFSISGSHASDSADLAHLRVGQKWIHVDPFLLAPIHPVLHVTYVIETEVAGDHILDLLSSRYLKDPAGLFSLLSEEEKIIFWLVYARIEQF